MIKKLQNDTNIDFHLATNCHYLGSQVETTLPSSQNPLTALDRRHFYLMKTAILQLKVSSELFMSSFISKAFQLLYLTVKL